MRPTIVRPDLGEINDRFDLGIDGASSAPGDRPSPERTRVLKRLVLTTYQQLMDMSNDDITHSDWAWSMRVVVETSLRDIMQLGIIRHIFDLVYSLFCGCVGAPVSGARLDRYSPQYGRYQTTFRDAYAITCGYFQLFDHDERQLKKFCAQHDQDTALCIVLQDLEKQKPPLPDEDARETVRQLRNNFWKDARAVYFQLKNEGRETLDFDVVFDNQEPPFPDHVFLNLAGSFFTAHGWLPVGDNVGLFKDENVARERPQQPPPPNPPLLARVEAAFKYHGNPPNQWQVWWRDLGAHGQALIHETIFMTEPGLVSLAAHRPASRREEMLIDMFPEAKKLSPAIRRLVALHFHVANALNSFVMHQIQDYSTCVEGLRYSHHYQDPRGGNTRFDLHGCFSEMMAKSFGVCDLKEVQDPTETGKVTGLPFQPLIDQVQRASTFCFLRELLTNYNPKHINKGIFFQACVDYANKHDPVEWHDDDDDWILWLATSMDHPMIINDKRLFMSPLPLDRKEVKIMERVYRVTEKGTVCYAYNRQGQGIYSAAYYCKDTEVNLLNDSGFLRLLGSVKRDYDTSLLELPRLRAEETLEGQERVSWRGYGLTRVDLGYWHQRLGHVSSRTLKRYQKVISGIPPYFWSEEVDCECAR